MSKRIYLSSPHMGGTELKYIHEAFDTNWISPVGPNISAFEESVVGYTGAGNAAALSSGTAAIHLALIMLGVGRGDEVLCSSFTFAGSCNPIMYVGATPVFIDSENETWNLDPELLEQAIRDRMAKGKKPKALILVHLYGVPAKLDELLAIAAKYDIPVIEDAAEALGSTYQGKYVGTFGDIGIYSFNGNKIITSSGGGMLVSDKLEYVEKAKFLATQARDTAEHYQHSVVGYNYRMSNICAGIGRGQMEILDRHVEARRKAFDFYKHELGSIDGISFVEEPTHAFCNRWLTTLLIDREITTVDRENIRKELEKHNIESRSVWKPMHLQPVYKDAHYYGRGVSDKLFEEGLCLPSGSNLHVDDLQRITKLIRSAIGLL